MGRRIYAGSAILSIVLFTWLLGGCGSGKREGAQDPVAQAQRVGSDTCIRNCHAGSRDLAGNVIAEAWSRTTHTTVFGVDCEDCHGGGSLHWGVGPMPYPNPKEEQCSQAACHAPLLQPFKQTAHSNSAQSETPMLPDRFFFQGDAGSDQASIRPRGSNTSIPEVTPAGRPVAKGQHIEECSVCHNPNLRFVNVSSNSRPGWPAWTNFNEDQNGFGFDDPFQGFQNGAQGNQQGDFRFNMPNPSVSCAGCHDAHQPQQMVTIAQRTSPVGYSIYRRYSSADLGVTQGTIFPSTLTQSTLTGSVIGTNREVYPERVCQKCHTVGRYKFSNISTHQSNVYPQWTNSGHANRNAPAWAEFSANPPAYVNPLTGVPYTDLGHQTTYPIDMGLRSFGATATTTRNAGINNFACFKCHNGLTSIPWQQNIQGTPAAPVVFGDATATCITCHDPHANGTFQSGAATTRNVRVPAVMTNYSTANVKIFGNVFLDNKPVPQNNSNATICIFCHQGRESGFTLYRARLAPGKNATGSFFNPHYLGTGAMLWGANGYEFPGKTYGANAAHQNANCNGCHMTNATPDNEIGGHSWNPNVASCNTSSCHGSVAPAVAPRAGSAHPDVAAYRMTADTSDYDGNGSLEPIAVEIKGLQDRLIALLAANGIFFNDLAYPYFFSNAGFTAPFTAWGTTTGGASAFKAAFNLQFVVKGLPSSATSQTLVPNTSAAVHNHVYIIQLLRDSYEELNSVAAVKGAALAGVRPEGSRPALVYGPGQ